MSAPFTNAIGWAQFRLLGGWRNTLTTWIAYAIIGSAAMFGIARALMLPASVTFSYFVGIFMGLQVLVLVVYGTLRVGGAVRSDVTSHVIESHRLMPVGSGSAILGYLLGAPIQALGLFAINCVLGGAAAAGASLPVQSWIFANIVLLCFSVFVWIIVGFFAFRTAWATPIVIIGPIIATMGGWMLLILLPGLSLLITPIMRDTIFDLRTGLTVQWTFATGIAVQAVMGALYFAAAARRYRRDDAIGFTVSMALLLLAAWVAASALGLVYQHEFQRFPFAPPTREALPAFVASYVSVLLVAILPVASGVRLGEAPPHGVKPDRYAAFMAVIAATAICLALLVAAPSRAPQTYVPIVHTGLLIAAFLLSIRYLLGIAHRSRRWARWLVFAWLLLTWCVPVLIDVLRAVPAADSAEYHMSQLALCSPPAEILQIWSVDPDIHTGGYAGLIVQCALPIALAAAYYSTRRHSTRQVTAIVSLREPC